MACTEQRKKQYIEYMLDNGDLESALQNWNKGKKDGESFIQLSMVFLEKFANNHGMIFVLEGQEMETDMDNIKLLLNEEDCKKAKLEMRIAKDENDKNYVIAFSSKKKFQKYLKENGNGTGVLLFMDDLFGLIILKKEIDGIVINIKEEEIIIYKETMAVILNTFERIKK